MALDDVLLAGKIGLEVFLFHPSAHATFALQQLQAHVGRSQVAAHANQVSILSSRAVNDILLGGLTQARHADNESCDRSAGIAAHQVNAVVLTGDAHALVQLLDVFKGEPLADAQRHGYLTRRAVHGIHVAQVHYDGFIAQMHQGHIGQVEMNALKQQVGRDQRLAVLAIVDDGTVIAHATMGGGVADGE